MLKLPTPRGDVSGFLLEHLSQPVHALPAGPRLAGDDDLHLALYTLYELHYRGLPGVDDDWEWEPSLLALRGRLERRFEAELRERVPRDATPVEPGAMDLALRAVEDDDEGPALSAYLERDGSLEQFREFAAHRSAYQLKEADPHSWALPRMTGAPKAALVEIQADEYGGGRAERMHAALFAKAMTALGLDDRYGAYVDLLPGVTLRTVNLMSLCGLHRRLLGAIVGHLALFEMTSAIPNRRYGNALRRLGLGEDATDFFDEHVTADAVHEAVAAVDLAGGLVRQDPALGPEVLWGARCLLAVEGDWAAHLLQAWETGRTSLRAALPLPAPV